MAGAALVDEALRSASVAAADWSTTPAGDRARALEAAADAFEAQMPALIELAVREAGKSIPDGIAEVREAVDFPRHYAARARAEFGAPLRLPGPTGESNELSLHGRGVFVCISPWNFPLAIFTGQVAAALAAGNAVIAKPAEQTPLIAAAAVRMLHASGVPGPCCSFCRATASRSAREPWRTRGWPAWHSPAQRKPPTRYIARSPAATDQSRC